MLSLSGLLAGKIERVGQAQGRGASMSTIGLFDEELAPVPPQPIGSEIPQSKAPPRYRSPNRDQLELHPCALEDLVAEDHPVRAVWAFVQGMDLSALYEGIRAVEGRAGRPAIDPLILVALWLYATIEGVGSARALARLCLEHHAYRWLCGGVSVNYHTLADFRVAHTLFLDQQLTISVATLEQEGLVQMKRVAQDGIRIRASAGAASFRRQPTLEELLGDAEEQLAILRRELDEDPSAASKREQAAKRRAAQERKERVEKALRNLPEVEAKKKANDREKARVSTTDPQARVMKMADGGFRPAFNGQFAADTESQIIVGVEVTNEGSDQGQMEPMLEQLTERYEKVPEEYLVDGGFASHDGIEQASKRGTTVYAPVPKPKDGARDPHARLATDSNAIGDWRERMGTEEAKAIYKDRAATAECVNAIARNRGLQQFRVRGRRKVKTVLLWYALAHNMMRGIALRLQQAAQPNCAMA
jgi:transposase